MEITRIKPPKFRVGRYSLNEYELRLLMLEVAEGKREPGIRVHEVGGRSVTIGEHGFLSQALEGLGVASEFTMALIRVRREKGADGAHLFGRKPPGRQVLY